MLHKIYGLSDMIVIASAPHNPLRNISLTKSVYNILQLKSEVKTLKLQLENQAIACIVIEKLSNTG